MDIRDCLTVESVPKVDARLTELAEEGEAGGAVELNHSEESGIHSPIKYSLHRIGPDGTVLMLGRDLRPIAEMQEQLVKAQLALERDYETQRDFDTRYRVLMETTRDALVFVSLGTGRIVDANSAAADLLGTTRESLSGSAFAGEFEGRRRGEFLETLVNAALAEGGTGISLTARRQNIEVSLTPRAFRAAGERLLLIRVEAADFREAGNGGLTQELSGLYEEGVDAIVFTDTDGVIRAANDSFLNLTDAAHLSAVKGKSLGQFLSRGAVDLKVLLDNAARPAW